MTHIYDVQRNICLQLVLLAVPEICLFCKIKQTVKNNTFATCRTNSLPVQPQQVYRYAKFANIDTVRGKWFAYLMPTKISRNILCYSFSRQTMQ